MLVWIFSALLSTSLLFTYYSDLWRSEQYQLISVPRKVSVIVFFLNCKKNGNCALGAKKILTSAKKPFCATAVINGSTERAAVVYPETCIETLTSLGKMFLGDENLVPRCTIKFVCLQTTVVAWFSFRLPFHQRSLTGYREQIKLWNHNFSNLKSRFPPQSKAVISRNLTGNTIKYDSSANCRQWCSSTFTKYFNL